MFPDDEESDHAEKLPSFQDILKEYNLLEKSEPKIIRKGPPPFRIEYPLEGFENLYKIKQLPPQGRHASSIPVAKNDSRSVESASPQVASQTPPTAAPASEDGTSGTVVKLPPKKKQTEEPSSRVDEFLEKIPDLSFMLSSELSLPAQS
jgi:hypothetical protein